MQAYRFQPGIGVTMFKAADHEHMTHALRMAELGLYSATPNPRVGCVIVSEGVVIGAGGHIKAGEGHAEVLALQQARQNFPGKLKGADVYVTLEPCSHFGRTPPCVDALIEAGVARVFAAMQDPNPLVSGNGLARLSQNGIANFHGLMQAQARELNAGFISRMTHQRPFVRSKIAASLDGRTALANGESKWITGSDARLDVHRWRARACAILTGAGTVLADDPQMNVRGLTTDRQPLRVVVDSHLSMPLDAQLVKGGNVLIAYVEDTQQRATGLQALGAELLQLPASTADQTGTGLPVANANVNLSPLVCLHALMHALAQRGINELLVEAGQGLNGALLQQNLIDEFLVYYAPVLMGSNARGMFAIPGLQQMEQRTQLEIIDMRQIGRDIRMRARPTLTTQN